jgi:hypothetical protein
MTAFVALVFLVIGFALGRRQSVRKKTPQEITVGVLNLLNHTMRTPMEYREICEKLRVYTEEEQRFVFEELMKLTDEETVCVSEEMRLKRVYRKHVNVLA